MQIIQLIYRTKQFGTFLYAAVKYYRASGRNLKKKSTKNKAVQQ